jgi:hypothetical protein
VLYVIIKTLYSPKRRYASLIFTSFVPPNPIYTSQILLKLTSVTHMSHIPFSKSHAHFPLLRSYQRIHSNMKPYVTLRNVLTFMVTTRCLLSVTA